MNEQQIKWFWIMNHCKINQIPPAQKWAWDKAEKEYNRLNDKQNKQL